MLNSHSKYMIKMRKLGIPPDASSGLPPPRSRGRTAPSERTPRRRPGRWTSWRSNWSDIFLRHHSHHAVCPKCKESKGSVSPHQGWTDIAAHLYLLYLYIYSWYFLLHVLYYVHPTPACITLVLLNVKSMFVFFITLH